MNFYDFLELEDDAKAFVLWHHGVYLLSSKKGPRVCKLYALDDFYVEVIHEVREGHLYAINTYESIDFLDKYLDQIDLSVLCDARKTGI
jgi:hypothetical protein